MKKLYEMPSIELTKFDVEDVITASSVNVTPDQFEEATGVDVAATWNSAWNTADWGI